MKRQEKERGAAAVEFALVLPLLMAILLGIMEFGFIFNQQVSATNAAREGARFAAVHYQDPGLTSPAALKTAAADAAKASAPMLVSGTTFAVTLPAGGCAPGKSVTVTVQPTRKWLTGFFDLMPGYETTAPQITGQAVMQCGG